LDIKAIQVGNDSDFGWDGNSGNKEKWAFMVLFSRQMISFNYDKKVHSH
jgi:hypothetical protein